MAFTIAPVVLDPGYGEAILSLADAKAHLRLESTDDDEDALVGALRDAAIDVVERHANVRLGPVVGATAVFDGFGNRMAVGVGPAATFAVTGVSYVDRTGATVMLDAADWRVVSGALWPRQDGYFPSSFGVVTLTFNAGYPSGTCPPALISAVKLMLGHLYANRESVGPAVAELPLSVRALCDLYRMPVL